MYNSFCNYIAKHNLFNDTNRILIAVSGGVDSVVLLDLLKKYANNIAIAHCNFQLRDLDSEEDEKFVYSLSLKYKVPFHTIRFDTSKYCKESKVSIQMGARKLRYNWFEQVRQNNGFDYIAVAHHADDVNETFFLNLIRGTGIAGLRGIKNKSENIIRPLLFASKREIMEYAETNNLIFREDQSNASLKYKRNIVRHSIIPQIRTINENFDKNLQQTIDLLDLHEKFFNQYYNKLEKKLEKKENDIIIIDYEVLMQNEFKLLVAYKLFSKYGFTPPQIKDIINTDLNTGAEIKSQDYTLLMNRKKYLIKKNLNIRSFYQIRYYINIQTCKLEEPYRLTIKQISKEQITNFTLPKNIAMFDLDKLIFPIYFRKWDIGDYFFPFGLNAKKKISDYFKDIKLSKFEKENQWLLCSDEDIIWVTEHRTDDRFKVTPNTKNVLLIEIGI
ncbi:MAG: tRNA lysidine(34) synthetase TilS [Bacteroidetes bacterium GWE2_29_8]|nr:MAG: tRNA lysidine(34) synthetase TilS [Bacteroidetes bacterium GWE2_29_8]OFY21759.1 MAG: tRNA lysidine(34) synthetase TilS [Bacteroidetes bacterium GWF2_29_10]